MTGEETLLARGTLGVLGSSLSLVLVSIPRLRTIPARLFDRLAEGALILSRLGLFAFVFLVLHLKVRGDIPTYYWDESNAVLRGGLPYRDYTSSYAPLHAFLDAALLRAWYSPLILVLFAIVAEWAVLPVWLSLGRKLFPEQELRTAALLYLASPLSLIFVAVDGQDNVVIGLLLAISVGLLLRRREALSGVAVAVAVSVIKFLPLLFTPVFFFATPRRWRWAAAFTAVVAVVYGTALALHLPITQPVTVEGNLRTAGNLPYLFEVSTGFVLPGRLWDGLVLLALAAIFIFVGLRVRGQELATRVLAITFAMPTVILALVFLSKKGWPNYLMLVLFPLCLLARKMPRGRMALFTFFATVAVLEHSYWATMLSQTDSGGAHHFMLHHANTAAVWAVMLGHVALELLLIGGYCWLLVVALREIARVPELMAPERGISGDS